MGLQHDCRFFLNLKRTGTMTVKGKLCAKAGEMSPRHNEQNAGLKTIINTHEHQVKN